MKILIGYGGSESADAAIEDLQRAGLGADVEALVMTVADVFVPIPLDKEVENSVPMYIPPAIKRAHERAEHKLEESRDIAKRVSEQIRLIFPTWRVSAGAEADSPAWALIRKADSWKPDLIVMGARGHSVFGGRLILGSISQRVLYEARCSVRIARASDTDDKPVRLLIGVDNSADSNAAVEAVCNRHWPRGAEVGLLAVVDTVMPLTSNPSEPSATKWIEVADESNWNQVREIFEPAAQSIRRASLHAEVLIRRGDPTDEILDEANTWGADCIFVGARGTRGIDRLLLGSVSSAVSSRAQCSVEVVRMN